MNNIMNVTYHSSDLFAPVLATSIVSLFENNKSFDEIHVYIFENPLSKENKDKLLELASTYNRTLHFIPMPDINREQDLGLKDVRAGWFFNSYMKLYLDELLPSNIDRILYLDSDILITGDLTELWNIDMEGHCAAGVIDCLGEEYYRILGLNDKCYYCNSGMILEDLKVWREKKIGDKVREYCKKNGGYVFFMEQTAFNAALQDDIFILDPKYNMYSMMEILSYEQLIKLRHVKRYYTKEQIKEAVSNPIIVHLTNSFLISNRAWYENSNHPKKKLYEYYKSLTPWKNERGFEDTRSLKKKIIQFFVDYLPRNFVISISSYLYNNYRVKKIEKTIIDAKSNCKKEME